MRIAYDNEVDNMSLTPATEDANYPVENIQDIRLSKVYRSTDDADETIVMDAGAGNTINPTVLLIAAHNITDAATISIQGNATDSWGSPTVDESVTHDAGVIVHTFTGSALRYWRLYVDDDANPDTYIEIGRVFLGTYLQMPNVAPGIEFPRQSTTQRSFSLSGQIYANRGIDYLAPGFEVPVISDAERQAIDTMWLDVGNHKPVFLTVWEDSLSTLRPIYCVIDQEAIGWRRSELGSWGLLWETAIQFREVF